MVGSPQRADVTEETARPQVWSAVVVLLLPFIPTALAIAAFRVGLAHGCAIENQATCTVSGFNLGDIIQFSLAAAWLVVFGVWAPVLVATSIVHRALDGFGPRLIAGGVFPAAVIIGSVVAPTIASAILKPETCSLQNPGPQCQVFATDMQQAFALAGIEPWPLLFVSVPAVLYVIGYMIVLALAELAERARARLALRAAEAAARQAGLPPPVPGKFQKKPTRTRKSLVYIPPKRRMPETRA